MAFKFCPECGTAVSVPEAKFCMHCGFSFAKIQQVDSGKIKSTPNSNALIVPQIPVVSQVSFDIFDMYVEHFATEVKQNIQRIEEAEKLILKCEMVKAHDILSEMSGQGYDRVEYLLSWIYSLNENGIRYDNELAHEYCTLQPINDVLRILHVMNIYLDEDPKFFHELEEGVIPLLAELEQDKDFFTQLEVALYYLSNNCSRRDKDKGIRILEEAEKNGFWIAAYFLGSIYMNVFEVKNVRKDAEKAIIHFSRASRAGSSMSAFILGGMYFEGKDIKQNIKRARKYLNMALERNEPAAKDVLDEIDQFEKSAAQQEIENQQEAQAEILEALKSFLDQLNQTYQIPCLYFNNQTQKGYNKISSAIKYYAPEAENEFVIFVFDDTITGIADDGILVSSDALYICNAFENERTRIPLTNIVSFRIESKNKNIWINDNIRLHLDCCRGTADLQVIINIINDVQQVFL